MGIIGFSNYVGTSPDFVELDGMSYYSAERNLSNIRGKGFKEVRYAHCK